MELGNKRTVYNFENQSNTIKFKGEATNNETLESIIISAEIKNMEDIIIGTFYYMENKEGKINKSIDNVDKNYLPDIETLIASTISEFKSSLNPTE